MSDALFATTQALRARIAAASGASMVHVGAPPDDAVGDAIALILFDIQPNAALRNVTRFAAPPSTGPVTGPAARVEAIALDLRYMVYCPRANGTAFGSDPEDLRQLGAIVAALHADPVLNATPVPPDPPPPELPAGSLEEQIVRVSLESYGLDEWNRIWSMLPQIPFRTSLAYLATPVWVTAGTAQLYPRVRSRENRPGVFDAPPQGQAA